MTEMGHKIVLLGHTDVQKTILSRLLRTAVAPSPDVRLASGAIEVNKSKLNICCLDFGPRSIELGTHRLLLRDAALVLVFQDARVGSILDSTRKLLNELRQQNLLSKTLLILSNDDNDETNVVGYGDIAKEYGIHALPLTSDSFSLLSRTIASEITKVGKPPTHRMSIPASIRWSKTEVGGAHIIKLGRDHVAFVHDVEWYVRGVHRALLHRGLCDSNGFAIEEFLFDVLNDPIFGQEKEYQIDDAKMIWDSMCENELIFRSSAEGEQRAIVPRILPTFEAILRSDRKALFLRAFRFESWDSRILAMLQIRSISDSFLQPEFFHASGLILSASNRKWIGRVSTTVDCSVTIRAIPADKLIAIDLRCDDSDLCASALTVIRERLTTIADSLKLHHPIEEIGFPPSCECFPIPYVNGLINQYSGDPDRRVRLSMSVPITIAGMVRAISFQMEALGEQCAELMELPPNHDTNDAQSYQRTIVVVGQRMEKMNRVFDSTVRANLLSEWIHSWRELKSRESQLAAYRTVKVLCILNGLQSMPDPSRIKGLLDESWQEIWQLVAGKRARKLDALVKRYRDAYDNMHNNPGEPMRAQSRHEIDPKRSDT